MTATTPKQEAVTAAVVASPEKLADAIDKLAHFVGWATLAHMKVKFRNDLLAPAQEAMVTLRELQFASTIPRVADHLEDGGKAELLEALRYYADAKCADDTCGGGYYSLMDDGHVARNAIKKAEADPQRTAIGMRREGS